MSTKAEKPVLQGQRIKTRKRDEKAKFDPTGFRDSVIQGLSSIDGSDLDAVHKYLDGAGSKLDYRAYGETLFDILLAGGILAPGGLVSEDGAENGPVRTSVCVFGAPEATIACLKPYAQLIVLLMRRYKYLEKMFIEEVKKVMVFLRGFSEGDRARLAICVSIWCVDSIIDPKILGNLIQDHLVRDGIAVEFLCQVLRTARSLKDAAKDQVPTLLRKAGLERRINDFFPCNKRTVSYFTKFFEEQELPEIIDMQTTLKTEAGVRKLVKYLTEHLHDNTPAKELSTNITNIATSHDLADAMVVGTIWTSVMADIEWNKKDELVADQALKHLRNFTSLFQAHATTARAELQLLVRIQEFCYENMNFMKVFQKIVLLFYKNDVLSEEVILKWFKDGHSSKGKTIFLDQMKKFVEWLQNAEEESDESGED